MNIIINEKPNIEKDSTIDIYSDNTVAKEIDYSINYTLPLIQSICGFYEIPYKRIKKQDLIYNLVEFESNIENIETVEERKRLWFYMEELKKNKYLSKYIIYM
tara:strand:- start:10884 stop:11192 length:309 start_codon:yes stop_codon:yes gene_type:complete